MIQKLQAREIDIRYLIDNFGLQQVRNPEFFREWQDDLPEITDTEKQLLDRVKEGYFNLLEYPPLLESVVKLTIVSPILFLAGFYVFPFHIKAEKSIQIQEEDEGKIIEGSLITTGANFTFVKLLRGEIPQYATSNEFVTRNSGNELYSVLQILKRLSQLTP